MSLFHEYSPLIAKERGLLERLVVRFHRTVVGVLPRSRRMRAANDPNAYTPSGRENFTLPLSDGTRRVRRMLRRPAWRTCVA